MSTTDRDPTNRPPATGLAEVLTTIRRLEAEKAVVDTLYRLAHSVDDENAEAWVGCFTADAHLEAHYPGDPPPHRVGLGEVRGKVLHQVGREQLRAFVEGIIRQGARKHLVCQPMVEIEGARAKAVSYYFTVEDSSAGPRLATFGRWLDTFSEDDGRWLIKRRIVEMAGEPSTRRRSGS